jgi:hypothetical protein
MAGNWRDKLHALLELLEGGPTRKPAASSSTESDFPSALRSRPATVNINFGIDFGTSFTKVCFRDVGTEESAVVSFGDSKLDNALIRSVVACDPFGHLYMADQVPKGVHVAHIPYLKMRLAGATIGDKLPTIDNIDLNDVRSVSALSSWFLASVLRRSQQWIARAERDRLKGRVPVWSANIGVPVAHYDSPSLETFDEVLNVAWQWVKKDQIPATIGDVISAYSQAVTRRADKVTDFHAIPEIAAAIQSFVISREASPGIYVYFDIGGGTLDGVAFDFINNAGERRIHFYSGKVEPLGISAVAGQLVPRASQQVDVGMLEQLLQRAAPSTRKDLTHRVRLLVAYVVMIAKGKDARDWQREVIQNRAFTRKPYEILRPSQMYPLVVFLGGGGAPSPFYQGAISSTYTEFQHGNAGIPPYKLVEVPKPSDFDMRQFPAAEFKRFAIGYGLSIPFGEGPEIKLPSQFKNAEKPPVWQPRDAVDYANSKDVYD